ncbi:hypothetical protein [Clostridium botulinum]|uniref:hypothetical protein n=1 Tax=Clostridium botulinum TaxID=1491 RepID=UPI0004AE1153|nr:hypothetical protein [Clostridium botulinum]MBN3402919.1 hypothetical protein [Clostridium botulinum]MBN3447572.1 hypothetical protein [Clostridium botulinum]QDY27120.1 hypothetical protein CGQ40_20665 [Clostridium botulinum]
MLPTKRMKLCSVIDYDVNNNKNHIEKQVIKNIMNEISDTITELDFNSEIGCQITLRPINWSKYPDRIKSERCEITGLIDYVLDEGVYD